MRGLNYNHLFYFWQVARLGSVGEAAQRLHLTPQTISGQLRQLEESLGTPLFRRHGRGLALTGAGELALGYAEDMFARGAELQELIARGAQAGRRRFTVGVLDVVPKLVAYRLLAPALSMEQPVRLICRENSLDNLLGQLAGHRIDMLITDRPIGSSGSVRVYSHRLAECGLSVVGRPEVLQEHPGAFPQRLDGAPLLLPSDETYVRRALETWLGEHDLRPAVVGEFDDMALMRAFGEAAAGFFPVPSVVEDEVVRQCHVEVAGRIDEVTEHFYAVTMERRITDPVAREIQRRAGETLNNSHEPLATQRVRR